MDTTQKPVAGMPSLESLVETGMLKLESLHPGGLELTRELAELCKIQEGAGVLDVASGTGESACFLVEQFAARVYGVDRSEDMVRRADAKAHAKGLDIKVRKADASKLPFPDAMFDAAICECTLCLLEKERVIGEMVRVVRAGGMVGMHDLYWKQNTPESLKRTLAENEDEEPETIEKWQSLFGDAGLVQIKTVDKSDLMARWMRDSRKQLGLPGHLALAFKIIRQWGIQGLRRIIQSERVFSSGFLGYAIVVGTRR